ncbi:UPF0544 protein C5orf45 [Harpegnathos saltator]|uniref:UPF0544 protein C5orf45 n=2 Tax=Harpegnathos saltator TaxID=610380 RepID=E2BR96_HARSA|nr:UPF0544 protein C5orf45 [Harpegnathos saltator]
MYQVHIVKKARRWQCKLCNEKQSVKQIYFQGSGKDCRLHVQQLNSLKANESLFCVNACEQDDANTHHNSPSNVSTQVSDNDKAVENKWTKYLDSLKKEELFDTGNSSSEDISEVENVMSGEKSLCNDENSDSCSSDRIIDDSDFEIEDVTEDDEAKDSHSISCSKNSDQCDNSQDNNKSSNNQNNVTSIFETYDELDNSLDF